jgi:hypothetical protein
MMLRMALWPSTSGIRGCFLYGWGCKTIAFSGSAMKIVFLLTANETHKSDFDSSFDSNIQGIQGNKEEYRGTQRTFLLT